MAKFINQNLQPVDILTEYKNTSFPRGFESAQIDETTTIYRVFPAQTQPSENQIGAVSGYEIIDGKAYEVLSIRDKNQAEREAYFFPHLDQYYASKLNGGVTVNGLTVPTTNEDRVLLVGAVTRAQIDNDDTIEYPYYPVGAPPITLTNAQFKALGVAIANHVQKCLKADDAVRTQISDGTITSRAAIYTAFEAAYAEE